MRKSDGNGFFKVDEVKSVIRVSVPHTEVDERGDSLKDELLKEEKAKYKAAQKLLKRLVEENFIQFEAVKQPPVDSFEDNITYYANIHATMPGHTFMQVQNESLKVDGELFNEDEIIEAIRKTYPERFV